MQMLGFNQKTSLLTILRTVLVKVLETPIPPSTFTLTLNPSPLLGEGLQSVPLLPKLIL